MLSFFILEINGRRRRKASLQRPAFASVWPRMKYEAAVCADFVLLGEWLNDHANFVVCDEGQMFCFVLSISAIFVTLDV